MDQAQLLELARQALGYMSPLIAAGALQQIGAGTGDAARQLAATTWAALARRFKGDAEAEAALTLYKAKPADEQRRRIVEGEIVARFEHDPGAVDELAALVQQARALGLLPAQVAGRIHNQVIRDNARVGVAVAGDVTGGITTGNVDKRRGAFVEDGTVHGPVVGDNSGTITSRSPARDDTTSD